MFERPRTSSVEDLLALTSGSPPHSSNLLVLADELMAYASIPRLRPIAAKAQLSFAISFGIGFVLRCLSVFYIWSRGDLWLCRTRAGIWMMNTRLFYAICGAAWALVCLVDAIYAYQFGMGRWSPRYMLLLDYLKWPFLWMTFWWYFHAIVSQIVALEMQIGPFGFFGGQKPLPTPDERRKWKVPLLNCMAIVMPILVPLVHFVIIGIASTEYTTGYDIALELASKWRQLAQDAAPDTLPDATSLNRAGLVYHHVWRADRLRKASSIVWAVVGFFIAAVFSPYFVVHANLLLRMTVGRWSTMWRTGRTPRQTPAQQSPERVEMESANPSRLFPKLGPSVDKLQTGNVALDVDVTSAAEHVTRIESGSGSFRHDTFGLFTLLTLGYLFSIAFIIAASLDAVVYLQDSDRWNLDYMLVVGSFCVFGALLNACLVWGPALRSFLQRRAMRAP